MIIVKELLKLFNKNIEIVVRSAYAEDYTDDIDDVYVGTVGNFPTNSTLANKKVIFIHPHNSDDGDVEAFEEADGIDIEVIAANNKRTNNTSNSASSYDGWRLENELRDRIYEMGEIWYGRFH